MSAETFSLPISEMLTPESESQVCEILRSASQNGTPVYPIGGGTSLGLGLPAQMDGFGLQVGGLNKVVDYPARDMTITVGAGITMQKLTELLSSESQHLPIDAPNPEIATLGGLIATNHSGPRRFGQGTMRDHVIGIRAVDGRGNAFAAGGRVVKNVAGYDFCKLLTGSFGTLGVITEVTLKLKPLPAAGAFVHCQPANLEQAEQLLAAMSVGAGGVEVKVGDEEASAVIHALECKQRRVLLLRLARRVQPLPERHVRQPRQLQDARRDVPDEPRVVHGGEARGARIGRCSVPPAERLGDRVRMARLVLLHAKHTD